MQEIKLLLPKDAELPSDFFSFTPQEHSIILNIGYDAFLKTNKNVKDNFTDEKKKGLKLELEKIYKIEIEDLQNQLKTQEDAAISLKNTYEMFIKMKNETHKQELDERIQQEKEDYISQLKQFERLNSILQEKNDGIPSSENSINEPNTKHNPNDSVIQISKENKFRNIAIQSFRDFDEFDIFEIHSVDGQGDFLLKFKEFSVLVHSKKYSNSLNSKLRESIKQELSIHTGCVFGWLVSMETTIDKFDKTPFMFEWLSVPKCVCYVNSLLHTESPVELLRNVYFTCQTIFKMLNNEHTQEWNQTKQNEIRMREIIQKMIQNTYERNDIFSHLKQNFDHQDLYIRELLNKETNQLVTAQLSESSNLISNVASDSHNKFFTRIVDWWNFHIINTEGSNIRSSIIWTMFKRDNPDLVGEISAIEFKDVLYSFLSEDRIVKPRNKAGALEIKNIRWKIDRTMNIS